MTEAPSGTHTEGREPRWVTWGRLGLAETGNYPEPATPSLYNAMGSTQLARVLMEASGRLEPKAGDTTGSV